MSIAVEMRSHCRFCRAEWLSMLRRMMHAACAAGMLPGQGGGPRGGEDLHGMKPEDLGVLLVVAGDGDIAAVNAAGLGCTGPTNVLSFPGTGGELGELFLSAETMERECILYGQDPSEHAVRLLAHGMAHITGFDHGPDMDGFCSVLEASCLS